MKKMIALACLGFAFTVSTPAFAAGEKMKGCSKEATGMKGDERKAFMKKCLSKDYVLKSDAPAGAPAAAAAGEIQADVGFVEVAPHPDLGVLDHLAGHQGLA